MSKCEHEAFEALVTVQRFAEPGKQLSFIAEVQVTCAHCRVAFKFIDLPIGYDFKKPTMSLERDKAHLPISVDGEPVDEVLPSYRIKRGS